MIVAGHWLWRLDATQWCAAAQVELDAARSHVGQRRTAIAHCRRAAGMAANAVLVGWSGRPDAPDPSALETRWGRSYVDHLARIGAGDRGPLPADAVAMAAAILAPTMSPSPLVTLRAHPHADLNALLEVTSRFVEACATTLDRPAAV